MGRIERGAEIPPTTKIGVISRYFNRYRLVTTTICCDLRCADLRYAKAFRMSAQSASAASWPGTSWMVNCV